MVSLRFDDDTIDHTMRQYRSLDQDLFPIFSNTYTDSSESDCINFDVVESLTFFHIVIIINFLSYFRSHPNVIYSDLFGSAASMAILQVSIS